MRNIWLVLLKFSPELMVRTKLAELNWWFSYGSGFCLGWGCQFQFMVQAFGNFWEPSSDPFKLNWTYIFYPRFFSCFRDLICVANSMQSNFHWESWDWYQCNILLTMPTSDAPALNPDGSLKDASEIKWLNSPSNEHHSVSLNDPKKCKRMDSENNADELPSTLKGKAPAQWVGTKHIKILSKNVRVAVENNQFSMLLQNFFKNHFQGKYYFDSFISFISFLSTKSGVLQTLVCTIYLYLMDMLLIGSPI